MAKPGLLSAPTPVDAAASLKRAAGRLEIRLLLAGLAVMAAIWLFLGLTGEVREQETTRFDQTVLLAFRVPGHLDDLIGPRWVQESGRDVTALGGFTVLTVVTVMAVAMLLMHDRRRQALIFGAAVLLAQVAAETVKLFIDRPRPDLVAHHDLVYSSSFPSGHAMMTPVVYLTLAAIVAAGDSRRAVKATLVAGAAVLVACVGVSRVYLGVHWPTDVLAGWTLGVAIALAASMVLHMTARPGSRARAPKAADGGTAAVAGLEP
jgi:undecaprenyl-diphosphatase